MRVLLATDGSQDAHAATAWLAQFPLPSDAELRVVSAVHLPVAVLDVPPVHELHESLLAEAQRAAEAARATLASRFRSADVVVTEGDARQVILHAAEAWRADLLVLGARGLGAIAGALLGSISLGVARHARCSVLVVRGGTGRLRGALVAIDGSAHSQAAAEFLARLPLDPAFVVRLLGVAERPPYPATTPAIVAGIVRQAMAKIVEERRTALDQALGKAAASFASRVKRVEREVVVGQPVTQILEAAARPDVDLIVAGARGLGTLERLLLGSVSEGVLRHADRPLLIVKTPAP
jgi:nucleotide-binding universal stress UspA family protein